MQSTGLAFVGAGFHATTNIYPAAVAAGAEIQAIATRSLERSQQALLRFGSQGQAYDRYQDLLDNEHYRNIVIVAQPEDQFQMTMTALQAGKNVYTDKPLGWNAVQAQQAAEAAAASDSILMVGFMKRYAPVYQQLKELIDRRELGRVRSFQMNFAVDGTPFCKNEEQFIKLAAIHMIDLIRYLFGEAVDVTGLSMDEQGHLSQSISLRMDDGVIGSAYFTSMTAWSRESEQVTVTFENGFAIAHEINELRIHKSLVTDDLPWKSLQEQDTIYTPSATPMSGSYRDLYLRGFVGEMNHFMDCCNQGTVPLSSGQDNIATMALCDRILKALAR
ncbi:Gfo/Idh/MocA family protein [Paenibacillus shenyangensis]|uniref:Gfo/Idh/MocA family protein n=1 Tax=Paenibacillus sp. A9 TaxID=1284352 RepID=UPI000373151B|nr:Gfo/Idh/MocA family oxidoreductase [Paenibacillus sp. A9]